MLKEILLLGEFSTGKSAFLNMLLGSPILPVKLEATKLPVIKISCGEQLGVWVKNSHTRKKLNFENWEDISINSIESEEIEIHIPSHPILRKGIILYDTPGINSIDYPKKDYFYKYLLKKIKNVDLVIYFIEKNLTNTSLEFIKNFSQNINSFLFVTNFLEEISDQDMSLIHNKNTLMLNSVFKHVNSRILNLVKLFDYFCEKSEIKSGRLIEIKNINQWERNKVNLFFFRIMNFSSLRGDFIFEQIKIFPKLNTLI